MFEEVSNSYKVDLDEFFKYVEIINLILNEKQTSPELENFFIHTPSFFKNFFDKIMSPQNFIHFMDFLHDLCYSMEIIAQKTLDYYTNFRSQFVEFGPNYFFLDPSNFDEIQEQTVLIEGWFYFIVQFRKFSHKLDEIKVRFYKTFF